ncbi:NAD(P)/FAD-dependent oxidoreductase [Mesorhizobium wenxiniae]|uniref:FAD-dependent oxidoreductase n=1 Tax=Mesorhizobium wenxiniae TaxID=2014805 RepID=A0A271KAI4_9HYPH|nr:FAD-dependent oxidoreductase [Mesorhizobium wenxiniae]PAP92055.1 FAD-dependent oxidoreductase [Mesorhizobium wenxiniae]
MNDSVVIIGAGHAGVQAAASLREEGFGGGVILVGDEPELPYHKPPLSKSFIKDSEARSQPLRGERFYLENAIDLRRGTRISRIDHRGRVLDIDGGGTIAFKHLILATGSRARALEIEGGDLSGVRSLRSLADARSIGELSRIAAEIVILGGGFIGLELAATLAACGRSVTVVEAADRLLSRAVSPAVATHVRHRLEANGVRILTGTSIGRLDGNSGKVKAALTTSGKRLPAELVIVGIGAVPNVRLARTAGLTVANGIAVDDGMRTSLAGILAIGDVAVYKHWLNDETLRLESVQNATDQARLAARTVVGISDAYSAVPWFWSDIGDLKLQMVGLTARCDTQILLGDTGDDSFSVFHYLGDRLMGIDSVNRPADHMLGRKILKAGFSPARQTVIAGSDELKRAFAAYQEKK